ncbi:MAG: 2-C-methyl-D-erythritol 4-phosphate cytidylyltransferase [Bacteroidales bacterium]|nr:2-C-methyl-D-erythritol 4-phosphate cytidylyltransferase [Bacteroidales bacterium]
MKKSAIIVAGGLGTRINAGIPKQFLLLKGKPMLIYSIEAFKSAFPDLFIVLALPSIHIPAWRKLCDQYGLKIPHQVVAGGDTRFHSVQNALAVIDETGLVAIHDGARPLISETLIRSVFLMAEQYGNCIPVIPLNESVRILSGETSQAANRAAYRVVQTPQVFQSAMIKRAYDQNFQEHFSDDAVVAESMGETIHLIGGDPANLKITHPGDLAAAEALLGNQ